MKFSHLLPLILLISGLIAIFHYFTNPKSDNPIADPFAELTESKEKKAGIIVPSSIFDSILTNELIVELAGTEHHFVFQKSVKGNALVWTADFEIGVAPETYAYVEIRVAKGGSLLSEDRFKEAQAQFEKLGNSMIPKQLVFPPLGKRAICGISLGPGGGGEHCVFTTNDLQYDIEVSQGNQVPEGSTYKSLSIFSLAEILLRQYEKASP